MSTLAFLTPGFSRALFASELGPARGSQAAARILGRCLVFHRFFRFFFEATRMLSTRLG
jgi:hypothetical protein